MIQRILTHKLAPFLLIPVSVLYWGAWWLLGVLIGLI